MEEDERSRYEQLRSWHDEAYLYINQAITQVRTGQVGHWDDSYKSLTSGEAEHRQEGCGSDDVSAGTRITGPGPVCGHGGEESSSKAIINM